VQCLLQLVLIVGRDALPENTQLLRHLSEGSDGSGGAGHGFSNSSAGSAFSKLLTKLIKVGSVQGEGTTSGVRGGGAGGAGSAVDEEYVQWRVLVLQRIQQPLAVAYRCVRTNFNICCSVI
jgi:hypothetical protein